MNTLKIKFGMIALAAILLVPGGKAEAATITTNAATSITTSDATLNGFNGDLDAEGHSFWVSTSTFLTTSPTIPTGVYSTIDLGPISSSTAFSANLSSATGLPTVTPATTYYFAAWTKPVGGEWTPGEILSFPTATNLGTINITKYACPATTTVTRSANGVGGTVPEGCTLESGAYFGYVHGEQSDANGPYPELESAFTAGGTTNASGTLAISGLPSAGRYLVAETNSDSVKLAASDILGLYCIGDGDTSDNNDNQELTFVPAGGTVQCVAYNKKVDVVPPQSATLVLVKHSIGGNATFNFNLTGSTSTSTNITTVGGYATSTITLNVGTTTISESSLAGWNFTSANCVYEGESVGSVVAGSEVINVDNGDVVTCTFNNTSNTVGTIKVIKNVVGPDGETNVEDNAVFTVILGGESTRPFSESTSATFEGLLPGLYTITEATSTDYDLVSISGDVSEEPGVQVAVVGGLTNTITITNKQHATTTVSTPSSSGNQNTGNGASAGGSIIGWSRGSVLGASTDSTSCKVLISSYMKRGANNDAEQVKKLQAFLNSQNLGVTLTVNGIFDVQTESAVKLFQEKYAKDILAPWGLTKGTGFVYKTTLRWINHLACPGSAVPPLSL